MSDFEKYFESKYSTYTECNKNMLRGVALEAYEVGRKAGVDEGHTIGLEAAVGTIELEQEKIIHSPMFIGLGDYKREDQCDVIAAAIRERIK